MSKDLFFDIRAKEVSDIYNKPITKIEAKNIGKNFIINEIDKGEIQPYELMAKICRLKELIVSADTELRKHLNNEAQEVYGVKFTPVNGGNTINYKDDPVWSDLKQKLSQREELLKVALKSDETIYDSEGIEVPKVSTTPRKSSITIKF